MLFILLNVILLSVFLVWLNDRFKLERLFPKNTFLLFLVRFFGAILVWAFAYWLAYIIYPEDWIKKSTDVSLDTKSEQCWDKQGAYEC